MNSTIADFECLAIFVLDSDHLQKDAATWRAYMPSRDGERSFHRIDGLDYAEIARKGRDFATDRGKALHGWGIVRAKDVRSLKPLDLKVDEPPDRHGVIVGWPSEKHEQRSLAQSLTSIAETIRFPNPPER
jgi:hypothetical protein